jgi:hypothetical protein
MVQFNMKMAPVVMTIMDNYMNWKFKFLLQILNGKTLLNKRWMILNKYLTTNWPMQQSPHFISLQGRLPKTL